MIKNLNFNDLCSVLYESANEGKSLLLEVFIGKSVLELEVEPKKSFDDNTNNTIELVTLHGDITLHEDDVKNITYEDDTFEDGLFDCISFDFDQKRCCFFVDRISEHIYKDLKGEKNMNETISFIELCADINKAVEKNKNTYCCFQTSEKTCIEFENEKIDFECLETSVFLGNEKCVFPLEEGDVSDIMVDEIHGFTTYTFTYVNGFEGVITIDNRPDRNLKCA